MRKMTLLVLDGFGIGAMDDCKIVKPEDVNANTYKHIREAVDLLIPTLYKLGLGKIVDNEGVPVAAYGKSNLAHPGADTFLGHQELMGSKPKEPNKRLMMDVGIHIKAALEAKGYEVKYAVDRGTALLVNGSVVIGDNLESQLGNIINVVGDLNHLSFEELTEIGKIVRENVDTSRVIIFGNEKTTIETILSVVKENHPGQWGVDSPKANVYGEGYRVLHLGYGVDYQKQFAYMAEQNNVPVYRIGKTADVIQAEGFKDPVVNTKDVLETYRSYYRNSEENAVFLVNVQETDLAGHKEDSQWYKEVLEESDRFLASFIEEMNDDDLLIITADHGNDPTIGHSNHTREQTPILIVGKHVKAVTIGTRDTMADIAATMADFVGVEKPEFGKSFLQEIL
ncbi:phosphopentomutase [Jeotgalibacillus soli]|uniref:Phosphoglycerate mutase (2,3-diphosphoglycerate-independent) n=1 Tax=Jeotgalibacillus soli TaxID=889306 RepID=A0A0C2S7T3_9BACL|nr:phosphopentomutase [Jeotgalibacillus soli]KIL50049.1 phosphoglycerate mutase (2,3-diphosphoglycerate-independent) [Jeotgalibacillus soli]